MSVSSTFPGLRGAVAYTRWEPTSEVLRIVIALPTRCEWPLLDALGAALAPQGCAVFTLQAAAGASPDELRTDVSRLALIARGEHSAVPMIALAG